MPSSSHPLPPRSRAFTLIELLAVIAILGVLAAILVPVLDSARGQALRARALAQIRELGTASGLHAAEHQGRFPGSSHGSGGSWVASLLPYFGLSQTPTADQMRRHYRSPGDPHPSRLYSYAINDYLTPRPHGAPTLDYSRQSSVPNAPRTFLFSETRENYVGTDHFHFAGPPVSTTQFEASVASRRYRDSGIYIMADFHAEVIPASEAASRLSRAGDTLVDPRGNP